MRSDRRRARALCEAHFSVLYEVSCVKEMGSPNDLNPRSNLRPGGGPLSCTPCLFDRRSSARDPQTVALPRFLPKRLPAGGARESRLCRKVSQPGFGLWLVRWQAARFNSVPLLSFTFSSRFLKLGHEHVRRRCSGNGIVLKSSGFRYRSGAGQEPLCPRPRPFAGPLLWSLSCSPVLLCLSFPLVVARATALV